ncbi:MAG: hypothetical protein QXT63_00930, partial [Thermoplasmata archaeon]
MKEYFDNRINNRENKKKKWAWKKLACGKLAWKSSWRKGVSDLIGTLIVLTITVILFTGLITFVINLPGP